MLFAAYQLVYVLVHPPQHAQPQPAPFSYRELKYWIEIRSLMPDFTVLVISSAPVAAQTQQFPQYPWSRSEGV
jgi:hypothetical protein